ncbi:MAG: RnfABCDGE type electron transport complex subunit D [Candidatus Cloacimonadales bacterium]|nr:RnfABCDGE type electron transport complex subunit D [Candidatus Cloacimonadales bacterium]
MSDVYAVSAAPHIKQRISVSSVMWQVVLALTPALLAGIFFFGIQSLLLTLYAVVAAVCTEAIIQMLRKVPVTISDGSAVVTGMLIAFNINSASPWWLPVVGAVFAIAIGKQIFGGLGFNIFNPALLGRAFMVASWPTLMTAGWTATKPLSKIFESSINGLNVQLANMPEVITSATPLGVVKALRDTTQVSRDMAETVLNNLSSTDTIQNLFWGNVGGVIGEVSAAALLIGATYLACKHIIEWRIPISYIGTVFVLTYIFGGINGLFSASILLPFFHIFAGGLILGAFFMATDMVTSPVTKKGRIIFGIGCGILTVVIRLVGGYPEGVSYSILLMNIAVPLIDKYSLPRIFGEVKK